MTTETKNDAHGGRKVVLLMGMSLDGFGAAGWTPPVNRAGAAGLCLHLRPRRQ